MNYPPTVSNTSCAIEGNQLLLQNLSWWFAEKGERQTDRQRHRDTDRETKTERNTQRDRDRQTETHREKGGDPHIHTLRERETM